MFKSWLHKNTVKCYFRLALYCLLIVPVTAAAQDDYDSTVIVDTSFETFDSEISSVEKTDEEEIEKFDVITENDKIPVQSRNVAQKDLAKLKADDDFWYVDEAPKPPKLKEVKPPAQKRSIFAQAWFGYLLWFIIVGSFIAILVWFLMSGNLQLFEKRKRKIIVEKDELQTENIFDINYKLEIDKAVAAENYRLATRLHYLHLLKELAQKNIINYKQERTNSDYVLQLFGTDYYRDFFSLTRSFEYAWYGQFPVSKEVFHSIEGNFQMFKNRLPQ